MSYFYAQMWRVSKE